MLFRSGIPEVLGGLAGKRGSPPSTPTPMLQDARGVGSTCALPRGQVSPARGATGNSPKLGSFLWPGADLGRPGPGGGRGAPCGPAAPQPSAPPDPTLEAPRPPASHLWPERPEQRRELEKERGPRARPPGRARHSPHRRHPHSWPGPLGPPGDCTAPARQEETPPRAGPVGCAGAGAQPHPEIGRAHV